jgi:hypothetical protein
MTEITILVSPAFDRRGKRRHDRFDARLKDGGDVVCEATRQPLLDVSRVLLGRGVDPSTVICMVHAHAPAVVAMRAQIGVAARYTPRHSDPRRFSKGIIAASDFSHDQGHKRKSARSNDMSGLPPKADVRRAGRHVR